MDFTLSQLQFGLTVVLTLFSVAMYFGGRKVHDRADADKLKELGAQCLGFRQELQEYREWHHSRLEKMQDGWAAVIKDYTTRREFELRLDAIQKQIDSLQRQVDPFTRRQPRESS